MAEKLPDWQAQLVGMNAALPEGTFTPDSYMKGIGSLLYAPPIWNLNVYSLSQEEMVGQIDELKRIGVPVERLELGNEGANGEGHEPQTCDEYLAKAALVVSRSREVFPDAKIGIIGSWDNPERGIPPWRTCDRRIKDHPDLFDAVSVHTYSPGNTTLSNVPEWARPTVTLAAAEVLLSYHVGEAAKYAGGKPIWLDEFNWGGDWMGDTTWPTLQHGTLRGLHFASFYLSALGQPENAVTSLNWYSLFHQHGVPWSWWASCAHIPNAANTPEEVSVDAMAQVFAHLSFVALRQGYTQVQPITGVASDEIPSSVPIFGTTGLACVQAVLFSGRADRCTFLLLNRCSWQVHSDVTSPLGGPQQVSASLYNGDPQHVGGWTLLDDISSIESPPWVGGPVDVEQWQWSSETDDIHIHLNPLTLHIVQLTLD